MLKSAFERSLLGRSCPKCKKQIAHAFFQRHTNNCYSDSDDNDDVQIVGVVLSCKTTHSLVTKKAEPSFDSQTMTPSTTSLKQSTSTSTIRTQIKSLALRRTTKKKKPNKKTQVIELVDVEETVESFNESVDATKIVDEDEWIITEVEESTISKAVEMDNSTTGSIAVEEEIETKPISDREAFASETALLAVNTGSPTESCTVKRKSSVERLAFKAKERKTNTDEIFGMDLQRAYEMLVDWIRNWIHDHEWQPGFTFTQTSQSTSQSLLNSLTAAEDDGAYDEPTEIGRTQLLSNDTRLTSTVSLMILSAGGSKAHGDPRSWREGAKPTTSEDVESSLLAISQDDLSCKQVDETNRQPSHYHLEFLWKIVLKALYYQPKTVNAEPFSPSESAAFWGVERIRTLFSLFTCSFEAQRVFLRIFMRGRKWFPARKLRIVAESTDEKLIRYCDELVRYGLIDEASNVRDDEDGEDDISLAQCLRMLIVGDLAALCRRFKLRCPSNASEMIKSLCRAAVTQRDVFNVSLEPKIRQSALKYLGRLYRISSTSYFSLHSFLTVFSPTSMDTATLIDEPSLNLTRQLLFALLQLKTRKLKYPGPSDDKIMPINIYANYSQLEEYVLAKQMEVDLLVSIRKSDVDRIKKLGTTARRTLCDVHFADITRMTSYRQLDFHLRRFTAPVALIRCLGYRTEWLQKQRLYRDAAELLVFLVETSNVRLFCTATRIGQWYDRLALIYDAHLKNKPAALDVCLSGLAAGHLCDVDLLGLQQRAQKLWPKNACPLQPKLTIIEPKAIYIDGYVIRKDLGDQRVNHFYILSSDKNKEQLEFQKCSVETVALYYFRHHCDFSEGVHAEGAIWHTLFGLLCYDVIFDADVPDVWLSNLQTNPCDLNSPTFFANRCQRFETLFAKLEVDSHYEWMYAHVLKTFVRHADTQNSEISWGLFTDMSHVMGFLKCCKPKFIVAVFRRLSSDYRQFRSGFPDLTVWNPRTKKLAVVEVKGPNDRLSNKQRLWLDFFANHGVESLVCHVAAKNPHLLHGAAAEK